MEGILLFDKNSIKPLNVNPITYNRNKSIWISYEGNISNFPELLDEFPEINIPFIDEPALLITLYKKYGLDFVKRLNGSFIFVLYDITKKRLILVRDRLGNNKIYYTFKNNKFIFSSNIRYFTKTEPLEVNINILYKYLIRGYILGPSTIFKNIKKLLPSQILILNNNKKIKIRKYWQLAQGTVNKPLLYHMNHLKNAFSGIQTTLAPYKDNLGILSTGGVDSSILISLAAKAKIKLKTFFISGNDKTAKEYNRISMGWCNSLSKHFNTKHTNIPVGPEDYANSFSEVINHFDEPFYDEDIPALFHALKSIGKEVKFLLSGMGANELFGCDTKYIHNHTKTILSEDLSIHNKVSLACNVSLIFPYLNYNIMDISCKIPFTLKKKDSIEKYILRKTVTHMNLLPEDAVWRATRHSAMPYSWMEAAMEKHRADIRNSNLLKIYPIPDYIKKYFDKSGRIPYAFKIAILCLWFNSLS